MNRDYLISPDNNIPFILRICLMLIQTKKLTFIPMELKLSILVILLLSLQTLGGLVNASHLFFQRTNNRFYIQTDSQHFAIYARVQSSPIRVVSLNGDTITRIESNCKVEKKNARESKNAEILAQYMEIRDDFMYSKVEGKADRQRFTNTLSEDTNELSGRELNDGGAIYSSKHFPSKLARVIIYGNLNFFVHYDGYVAIKESDCLLKNEKNLIDGLNAMKLTLEHWLFHPPRDDWKRYLEAHPIDEAIFEREQAYGETD